MEFFLVTSEALLKLCRRGFRLSKLRLRTPGGGVGVVEYIMQMYHNECWVYIVFIMNRFSIL